MNWEDTFYNIHNGPCVVIGNGPSLRDVPLSFLRRYPTFGTNRIYLLPNFVCDFYVSVNPLVIQQSVKEINEYPAKAKFIAEIEASSITGSYPLVSSPVRMFSFNPAAYIFEGHTVTFACLQLAFFMGFETVLLVGVDHTYKMDSTPNSETTWEGKDPNHFDPHYFTGARWNNPDLHNSEIAYELAKKAFEDNGRRIINLGPASVLNVFEKGSIDEWI